MLRRLSFCVARSVRCCAVAPVPCGRSCGQRRCPGGPRHVIAALKLVNNAHISFERLVHSPCGTAAGEAVWDVGRRCDSAVLGGRGVFVDLEGCAGDGDSFTNDTADDRSCLDDCGQRHHERPTTLTAAAELTVIASPIEQDVLAAQLDITSTVAVSVEVVATSPDQSVSVPRTTAVTMDHSIPLVGLRTSPRTTCASRASTPMATRWTRNRRRSRVVQCPRSSRRSPSAVTPPRWRRASPFSAH